MVLVTVLLIVTLASMTAVYSVQGAATEVQASGSMKVAMLAKATAESLVMVGAAAIDELRASGSWSTGAIPTTMNRYRLPNIQLGAVNRVGALTLTTANMQTTATPTEADLRGAVGVPSTSAVSAYVPSATAIQETWMRADSDVGDPTRESVRVAITIFGELNLPGEAIAAGQARALHDSVSISQAYYDSVVSKPAP